MARLQEPLKSCFQQLVLEAGVDEAGRGCLVGPVCAAAVILPRDFYHPLLNDSKQLTEPDRELLRPVIEAQAISWAVAMVDHETIDQINILQATYKAMHQAIDQLMPRPELLLIDGNRFLPYFGILHQCVVKGDATYRSIAAASILAKTHRDALLHQLHAQYPEYGWQQNKGYGTKAHLDAIRKLGPSPLHRRSFVVKSLQLPDSQAATTTE